MDFSYDSAAHEPQPQPVETGAGAESGIDVAAEQLETSIEKAYERLVGANWGGWWNKVKQVTTEDLQAVQKEFSSLLSVEKEVVEAQAEGDKETLDRSVETVKPAQDKGVGQSTMLAELTKRAQGYIDDLDKDLEEIENVAGSYLARIGTDVREFMKTVVSVDEPVAAEPGFQQSDGEDAPAELLFNVPEDVRNQIYSTRLDAQLHALHTAKEPFLTQTRESQYDEFAAEFNVEAHSPEISQDLDKYPGLRGLMHSLVPEQVAYETFWTKYYYMRAQIESQEKKRRLLLQQAADDSENLDWDDDEEEAEAEEAKAAPKAQPHSTRASSESSYDIVSKNSSVLGSKVDLANESDSDDFE